MTAVPLPRAGEPIRAVLFDFHSTLVDQGPPSEWIRAGWKAAGRDGEPVDGLGVAGMRDLGGFLERIWEHGRAIDPASERDLDPRRHRAVWDALVPRMPGADPSLAAALYEVMLDTWSPYADTIPVLERVRALGARTAVVSNIGVDIRPVLKRTGLADLLDAVVLSCEVGVVKPDPRIYAWALGMLEVPAYQSLMVGDSWQDDGGAAALGVRTLILPRTAGESHGLDAVLRLMAG